MNILLQKKRDSAYDLTFGFLLNKSWLPIVPRSSYYLCHTKLSVSKCKTGASLASVTLPTFENSTKLKILFDLDSCQNSKKGYY